MIAFNINAMTQFGITPVSNESLARVTTVQVVCYRITVAHFSSTFIGVLISLQFLISDTIVVWRAWVLSHGYTTRISLAFCLFATSGTFAFQFVIFEQLTGNTVQAALLQRWFWQSNLPFLIHPEQKILYLRLFSSCLWLWQIFSRHALLPMQYGVLFKLCLPHLLIRAIRRNYRQHVSAYFDDGLKPGRTNVERVLTLLVESGSLYLVYWVSLLLCFITLNLKFVGVSNYRELWFWYLFSRHGSHSFRRFPSLPLRKQPFMGWSPLTTSDRPSIPSVSYFSYRETRSAGTQSSWNTRIQHQGQSDSLPLTLIDLDRHTHIPSFNPLPIRCVLRVPMKRLEQSV